MAPRFKVTNFLHPLDLSARQQLESIPVPETAVKKYLGVVTDRRYRQEFLSSALRLGPAQLPEYETAAPAASSWAAGRTVACLGLA